MTSVHHATLGDVVREHRRMYPDRVALVDGCFRVTRPELDDRVNQLANALPDVSVGADERSLRLGQNSFRVYELLLAARACLEHSNPAASRENNPLRPSAMILVPAHACNGRATRLPQAS